MLQRVRQLAEDMGTSMSEVVEVALAMHMPQLEAMWAAAQAAKEGEDAEEAAMMAGLRAILHTLKREEEAAT